MKTFAYCLAMLSLVAAPLLGQKEEPMFPFVLPWDDASPTITDISSWLPKPAGAGGFVEARGAHLYVGKERVRFFGVNLCFGANFPKHEDADKVAARLAKFGFNCVRFHHMDMSSAPGGIFSKDGKTLDPGQLDKLDYFIAQLAKHGIYSNINLHVSRSYPDMPKWDDETEFMKGVDLFYPPMLELQRDYARQLLNHVNAYTGKRYADDPVIAIVEINNENGLIVQWWGRKLDRMPEEYNAELTKLWNAWLAKQYKSGSDWKSAWSVGSAPEGTEMLRNGDFAKGTEDWSLEQLETAKAEVALEDGIAKVQVTELGKEAWNVQLVQGNLNLSKGKTYTLTFTARADAPRVIQVGVARGSAPWTNYWSEKVSLTTEPKEFQCSIIPKESDPRARLLVTDLAAQKGAVYISKISLRPAALEGALPADAFGKVTPIIRSQYKLRTTAAQKDWMRFLWKTEEDYWTGMQRFLKEEIKTRSLIVGTAVGFSPSPIQAKLDVVDSHSYWHHPRFPGNNWDPRNWEVNNTSMAGVPNGGTLPGLALRRVEGKPYICTEYNASAPNTYSSEAFLLSNAYAALQDWDGLFVFAYSHRRDNWDARRFGGFFDIDQHPAKLVTIPAAAAMFLRGDVQPAKNEIVATITAADCVEASMSSGSWWTADSFGVPGVAALVSRTGIRIGDKRSGGGQVPVTPILASDTAELSWDTEKRVVTVNTARSKASIGKVGPIKFKGIEVRPGDNMQNWAAITLTAMSGGENGLSGRWLLTATGNAGNTGMDWSGKEEIGTGTNWGTAPSVVEGIPMEVRIATPASKVKAWALDEKGARSSAIPILEGKASAGISLGSKYKTLWYEIEISE